MNQEGAENGRMVTCHQCMSSTVFELLDRSSRNGLPEDTVAPSRLTHFLFGPSSIMSVESISGREVRLCNNNMVEYGYFSEASKGEA
jgi:hypothetical protein